MNKSKQFRIILLIALLFYFVTGKAQKITNINSVVEGDKILISYDLQGITPEQEVIIKAYLSTDGGKNYGEPLKSVSGDVGLVTGPGSNKTIIWDVFNDLDELVSLEVKFKITADPVHSGQLNPSQERIIKLSLNTGVGSKTNLDYNSRGLNIKGVVYIKRFGIGLRADLFKTYRKDIDYSYAGTIYPDTGYYWGYSGGALIEYDLISKEKYSLYPFLHLGSSKILYQYNHDYSQESHFKYSVFGSIGIGFDANIYRFLYLGLELEYILSPWIDIIPSSQPDESLDGFNIGFVIKFVFDSG